MIYYKCMYAPRKRAAERRFIAMQKERKRRLVCLLLLVSIFLTLAFIFGNSIASREASGAASDTVNDWIGTVIAFLTGREDTALEAFLVTYSRKIAHFLEFALLGTEVLLLLYFSKRTDRAHGLLGALFAFFVASTDEGIQILSGRGAMVSDVWLDALGYISAYALGMLVLYLVRRKRKKYPTLAAAPVPDKAKTPTPVSERDKV